MAPMTKFFHFTRQHSALLPTFTYKVDTSVTNATLGRVSRSQSRSHAWIAQPTGQSRPLPGTFTTRHDAAQALWHNLAL